MAHVPAVHKEILLGLAGRVLGLDDEPSYRDQLRLCMYIDESGSISVPFGIAEDRLDALFLCASRQLEQDLVVMDEGEIYLRVNQHNVIKLRQEVTQLRLVGLKELTPDGDVKKEIGHLDIRTHGTGTRLLTNDVRAVYLYQGTGLILCTTGHHLHLRDRAYRR